MVSFILSSRKRTKQNRKNLLPALLPVLQETGRELLVNEPGLLFWGHPLELELPLLDLEINHQNIVKFAKKKQKDSPRICEQRSG